MASARPDPQSSAHRPQPRGYVIDHALVSRMMKECRAQTSDCLNDQFGISWNTWSKIRKGEPIRRSVALRLVERVLSDRGEPLEPHRYLHASN